MVQVNVKVTVRCRCRWMVLAGAGRFGLTVIVFSCTLSAKYLNDIIFVPKTLGKLQKINERVACAKGMD